MVLLQLVGDRNARHRDFERMYVERYWSISARLPDSFMRGDTDFPLDEINARAFMDYLMLCEDELDMRQQGYISDKTWKIWSSAIGSAQSNEKLKVLMDQFPDGRLDLLRNFDERIDPLTRSLFRRWWEGLV
ncbi:hypothetical protein ACIPVK_10950 [Paeniglutamicibacter sp. MACA_103]|uniref:hypothetical protein n=1 Tax=Paeniglutamicibacter sp. MACA_103 TaxID=3377337 RepID=UPI003892CF33